MTITPQAALLSEADMLDCLREATHEIPTRIPQGWRKVMQAAEKRIIAKLQATQEPAQAPDTRKVLQQAEYALWVCSEHNAMHYGDQHNTVTTARDARDSVLRALAALPVVEPVQAGELPDERPVRVNRGTLSIARDAIEYEKGNAHKQGYKQGYQQGKEDERQLALSARKPLTLTEIDGLAKVYAKTYSSPHHFSIDCEGIRKIINGIGLEVKHG